MASRSEQVVGHRLRRRMCTLPTSEFIRGSVCGSTSGQSPYHHGDLRHACLVAALELLEEGDETTLSIREVARRAGVSANAPYRHYPDKDALLAALACTATNCCARI